MSHSLSRVWIHGIWSTKYRQELILPDIEHLVYHYIKKELKDLRCPLLIINGIPDHVHCLFQLNPKVCIADAFKQMKGASSYWVDKRGITGIGFSWQTGYSAFSVSETRLNNVFEYIKNQ